MKQFNHIIHKGLQLLRENCADFRKQKRSGDCKKHRYGKFAENGNKHIDPKLQTSPGPLGKQKKAVISGVVKDNEKARQYAHELQIEVFLVTIHSIGSTFLVMGYEIAKEAFRRL